MLQILCRAERFAVTNPRVLIHSLSNARRATLRLLFFAERQALPYILNLSDCQMVIVSD